MARVLVFHVFCVLAFVAGSVLSDALNNGFEHEEFISERSLAPPKNGTKHFVEEEGFRSKRHLEANKDNEFAEQDFWSKRLLKPPKNDTKHFAEEESFRNKRHVNVHDLKSELLQFRKAISDDIMAVISSVLDGVQN